MKNKTKKFLIDLFFYVAGCSVYAVAIPMFISSAKISPGGFTGIALIFNYLFSVPTGFIMLALNTPLIIIGMKKFGYPFVIKTALVTVLLSVLLDIGERFIVPFKGDKMLCALFGGLLSGLALGLILSRGATTGGIDIIAKLIRIKNPHISVGRVILVFDFLVVAIAVFVYRDLSSALYSVLTMYISTKVLDSLLYGADKGKVVYIISEKSDMLKEKIFKDLGRGVTSLAVTGGYTGKAREMILCAVRRQEIANVYRIIRETDENAFTLICEAGEIIGEGFKK